MQRLSALYDELAWRLSQVPRLVVAGVVAVALVGAGSFGYLAWTSSASTSPSPAPVPTVSPAAPAPAPSPASSPTASPEGADLEPYDPAYRPGPDSVAGSDDVPPLDAVSTPPPGESGPAPVTPSVPGLTPGVRPTESIAPTAPYDYPAGHPGGLPEGFVPAPLDE